MSRVESHVAAVRRRLTLGIYIEWLATAAFVLAVLSFLVIASTAGAHLVTYLENSDWSQTHFMSSALVVAFVMLGTLSALDRKLKRLRTANCEFLVFAGSMELRAVFLDWIIMATN